MIFKVVESIVGNWYYHISETGKNMQPALCGNNQVMETYFNLQNWGIVTHIKERYCKTCHDEWLKRAGGADGTVTQPGNH